MLVNDKILSVTDCSGFVQISAPFRHAAIIVTDTAKKKCLQLPKIKESDASGTAFAQKNEA